MKVMTDFLGEVEVADDQIYEFSEGIYGFPDSKRFAFIGVLTEEFPFIWLKSLDEEDVVFVVTNPFLFKESYDFELNVATTEALGLNSIDETGVYVCVVVPEKVMETTANLKSPLILNIASRKGRQVILNEDYPYKFKIFNTEGA